MSLLTFASRVWRGVVVADVPMAINACEACRETNCDAARAASCRFRLMAGRPLRLLPIVRDEQGAASHDRRMTG